LRSDVAGEQFEIRNLSREREESILVSNNAPEREKFS
jgi:hypothetical protein